MYSIIPRTAAKSKGSSVKNEFREQKKCKIVATPAAAMGNVCNLLEKSVKKRERLVQGRSRSLSKKTWEVSEGPQAL